MNIRRAPTSELTPIPSVVAADVKTDRPAIDLAPNVNTSSNESSITAGSWDGLFATRSNANLLIADDDDVDRERISRVIDKLKLPVILHNAASGRDAILQMESSDIDILFLDYHLGDMTGKDVLQELRQRDRNHLPVIMITGKGDEDTAVEALRLGVFDYLQKKNITRESILSIISSALHASDLQRKLHDTQENLRRLSMYDTLTGLPNRNLFFDRFDQALISRERKMGSFCLLMIDLDMFKQVNDSLGHQAGDRVLVETGARLQAVMRKSDTVARLGGDEFAFILNDIEKTEHIEMVVDKIIATISKPILLDGEVIQIGASIGVARYPVHGTTREVLLSNADAAMYRAKKMQKNYEICPQEGADTSPHGLLSSQHIIRAIQEKELYLQYQPIIDLGTGQGSGVEVLVRWNSPEFGLVMPGNFISIAERSNLIRDITYETIEMAFDQLLIWHKDGRSTPLSINLSPRVLDDKSFCNWLSRSLSRYQLSPETITFEITETTLASSSTTSNRTLVDLIAMGFHISLDDFGSGFTSFKSIRNTHISELKIDRLFISQIDRSCKDAAIIRSLLLLADCLKIRAIAEGVETESQWNKLVQLGCRFGQGFGIARPMAASDMDAWLNGEPRNTTH